MSLSSPLLTTRSTARLPGQEIPGRYCPIQRLWVVPSEAGDIALISKCQELAAMTTKTNVELESDDTSDHFAFELATKTDTQTERDDESRLMPGILAIQTKTKVDAEQDQQDLDSIYAGVVALETKTFTSQEEDQQDTDRQFSDSVDQVNMLEALLGDCINPSLPLAVRLCQ